MRSFLQTNISTIFIMLGHECNLQCKYCLQHDVVNVALGKEINPKLYDFIIDVANNQQQRLGLQFYGGEPLVFWHKIKELIDGLENRGMPKNLYFSMITNGKLIDTDKVEYLNKYFSNVTISWDGRNSNITRGYNAFEDNKENIFQLKNFSVSGVISAFNYIEDYMEDCEELNADYVENYNGKTISFNVDELLDVNLQNQDLKSFDFDKVKTQITNICEQYRRFIQEQQPISVVRKRYIESKIGYLKNAMKWKHYKPTRDRCGNGCEVLNVDLQGNLYKCHNTDTKVGVITDNFFDILQNVFALDKAVETSEICDECPVQVLCMNGCPLVEYEARNNFYCMMSITMNHPILELVLALGSD